MNIIDFPPSIDEFKSLHFPEIANVWARNPEQQIEILVNQSLQDFSDVQSFVKAQMKSRRVKFIKVDPPQNGNHYYFICFGDDPDGLENSISFRIDQSWDYYSFPQGSDESAIEYLKSIIGLSGAIIGRLDFPEVLLSQKWLGDPSICYGYDGRGNVVNSESIHNAIHDYFLLAKDYWGVATMLDKLGFIWLWNTRNQNEFEVRQTGFNLKEWFRAELRNPFRQRREPEWVQHKTA